MDSEGRLRVRVRAAPADGAANKAIIRTLAEVLDVAPSSIGIAMGALSRVKRVVVEVDVAALVSRWPGLLTRKE